MNRISPERAIWLGGWLVTVVAALWVRGLLPIDETRYVSVAWEMWVRGDFLVPHLNGQPYSHKPPFLFWMINLGWWLFGVNEWWPRMLSSLFSLASLFLLIRLARLLRPGQTGVHELAPLILFSSLLWALFSTAIMFDIMLAFWVLLALVGVVQAAHNGASWSAWLLTGLALGVGMLSKGPVILLHVLPLALLAPFWVHKAINWKRWYGGLTLAVLIGVAIVLAWAIPAGLAGGDKYFHDIFWGQTANRMVKSFAHRREWWWYLPLLPVLLFPWLFWTPAWRRLAPASPGEFQAGRLLLIWVIPVFLAFSLISGKQPHYLLPLFPAVALWLAMSSHDAEHKIKGGHHWLLALMYVLLALAWLITPMISHDRPLPAWVDQLPQWPVAVFLFLAVAVLLPWSPRSLRLRGRVVALSSIGFTLVLLFGLMKTLYKPAFDLHEISSRIAALQASGQTVAVVGKYHNQFQFLGRLKKPIVLVDWRLLKDWVQDKEPAYLVIVWKNRHDIVYQDDEFVQPYRGRWMALLRRASLRANPELARP